jgi:hypothetical protein
MRASLMDTSLRVLTWGCVILLAILSLVARPTDVANGAPSRLEHFVAYAGSSAIAVPEAACRSLAAFGCRLRSWNTSSTFRPEGIQRSGILRRRHLERYAAVL